MSKNLRTPIIKPRSQGGTFYTFGSALEDIGLNINELDNKISLSHYMLLNLPGIEASSAPEGANLGDYAYAESLQNYMLNLETLVRDADSYNFAEKRTVSERVFWKWLVSQHGCKFDSSNNYYIIAEDSSVKVLGFGEINAGAQRTDAYGIYNETYVHIPSSYGQMQVLFKPLNDNNYRTGQTYTADDTIHNIAEDEIKDGTLIRTGISVTPITDGENSYTVANDTDVMSAVLSINELRKFYKNDILTYDDIATNPTWGQLAEAYKFNAVLLYYTIYDADGIIPLATNAYGMFILNNAVEDGGKYKFAEIDKVASTGTSTGNSYSFRVNIKTTSAYSGDVIVNDESVAGYEMSLEFNDMIHNLGKAVEILYSNAKLTSALFTDIQTMKNLMMDCLDKVERQQLEIQNLKRDLADLKEILHGDDTINSTYEHDKAFVEDLAQEPETSQVNVQPMDLD